MGSEFKTEVRPKSLNPLWNIRKYKDMLIPVDKEHLEDLPPIIIKVYDEDIVGDDYLGTAIIDF